MVALSIMACTHDLSAHTSYLFIVKDHSIDRSHFAHQSGSKKVIRPNAESGRPLYMLTKRTVNTIPSNKSSAGLI